MTYCEKACSGCGQPHRRKARLCFTCATAASTTALRAEVARLTAENQRLAVELVDLQTAQVAAAMSAQLRWWYRERDMLAAGRVTPAARAKRAGLTVAMYLARIYGAPGGAS